VRELKRHEEGTQQTEGGGGCSHEREVGTERGRVGRPLLLRGKRQSGISKKGGSKQRVKKQEGRSDLRKLPREGEKSSPEHILRRKRKEGKRGVAFPLWVTKKKKNDWPAAIDCFIPKDPEGGVNEIRGNEAALSRLISRGRKGDTQRNTWYREGLGPTGRVTKGSGVKAEMKRGWSVDLLRAGKGRNYPDRPDGGRCPAIKMESAPWSGGR